MQLACNGQREIYYWNMDRVFQPWGDRYFQYLDPLAAISCFQIRLRCSSRSMMGIQSMRIVSLQYLRGFAALLVVLSHNVFLLGEGWIKHIPGLLGVDIFFIISGFIMTFITYQTTERPDIIYRQTPLSYMAGFLYRLAAFLSICLSRKSTSPDGMHPLFLPVGLQSSGSLFWFQRIGATLDAVIRDHVLPHIHYFHEHQLSLPQLYLRPCFCHVFGRLSTLL